MSDETPNYDAPIHKNLPPTGGGPFATELARLRAENMAIALSAKSNLDAKDRRIAELEAAVRDMAKGADPVMESYASPTRHELYLRAKEAALSGRG